MTKIIYLSLVALLFSGLTFGKTTGYTLSYDSSYSFEETIQNLKEIVSGSNYRVFEQRNLLQGLGGKVDTKQVMIRFCNFATLKSFLKVEPKLGILLPCRIYVSEIKKGVVKVYMKDYRSYIASFGDADLLKKSEPLIVMIEEMIEDAL
jgi:cytochrome c oxidase cbb3-type subunit 3